MIKSEQQVHTAAAVGFQQAADAYDRGRPDYPPAAIEFLTEQFRLTPGRTVVDLGAGTGKFTSLIASSGAGITAIEPVAAMRERLSAKLPSIMVMKGTAQSIPLESSTQDVVFAAQAFHWFANEESLAEIRRVLRPGGHIVLIWNVRDESVAWVRQLTDLIDPYQGDTPRFRTGEWRKAMTATTRFGPMSISAFPYEYKYSLQGVIDRFLSVSFVAALPESEQHAISARIAEIVTGEFGNEASLEILFPYRTEVYWSTAI